MKNVLVTGADGFIGSHLTELLLEKNYSVRALSWYNSFNNWGWLEDIPNVSNVEVVCGDIRDPHFVRRIMQGVDTVFHLAALIAIPYSYRAPDSYIETNVKGTLNICQSANELGGVRVIHTSTSEVYGTAKYVPIDEKHPKQAQSPYSASKIGADALALSFYHAFGTPVTVARPFNTYGPRQSARAIIPTIISQIASGKQEIQVGNISPTRDFNFVKDTCRGILGLGECAAAVGREVNIASNSEISMADVLALIKDIMKSEATIIVDGLRCRPDKSEVDRLWGDNRLIRELIGYKPLYSIKDGLELTCDWFIRPDNLKKYKSSIYNL